MLSRRSLLAGAAALVSVTPSKANQLQLPSWLPTPTIHGAGIDKVAIDIPDQFRLPNGPAIWLAENGSDGNSGTFSTPLASLRMALARPEPVILCKPGRYFARDAIYGTTKTIVSPFGETTIFNPAREGAIVNEGGTLGIGAGITLEGVFILARPWQGKSPKTILRGCRIISAPGNGLTSNGGVSFASDVVIRSPQSDGFNYSFDSTHNFAIEHNCHVSDAGDSDIFGETNPNGSLRDNANGSSSHGCFVVRYGGLYEGSFGADVCDVWTAQSTDQLSLNYGVLTRASKIGVGFLFSGTTGQKTALLDGCACDQQSTDILASEQAWLSIKDFSSRKIVARSGARIEL